MKVRARAHSYAVRLSWTGASAGTTRDYSAYSREHELIFAGKPSLRASADPAFRGDASAYNPEELLVAALSSCHMLSYLALCARDRIAVVAYDDDAAGTMEESGAGGRFTLVTLRPRVLVDDDRLDRARALHEAAHASCYIASSVNFPVTCDPLVERAPDSY
jgi:organic hydroperoxide reductase OsmC/OhrA